MEMALLVVASLVPKPGIVNVAVLSYGRALVDAVGAFSTFRAISQPGSRVEPMSE